MLRPEHELYALYSTSFDYPTKHRRLSQTIRSRIKGGNEKFPKLFIQAIRLEGRSGPTFIASRLRPPRCDKCGPDLPFSRLDYRRSFGESQKLAPSAVRLRQEGTSGDRRSRIRHDPAHHGLQCQLLPLHELQNDQAYGREKANGGDSRRIKKSSWSGRNSASRPANSATVMPASHRVASKLLVSPLSAPGSVTATTAPVSRSTACSALCARWVRPSFIFAIRASSSAGLFHSWLDVRFLRLRSSLTRSSRVGVSMPEAFANPRRNSS